MRNCKWKGYLYSAVVAFCAVGQVLSAQEPSAQNPEQKPAADQPTAPPTPISTPSVIGPIQAPPPNPIGGDTMPSLTVNGAVTGMGIWQGNHVPGDDAGHGALSNGQVFLQKTAGWWQFYVQAVAYNIPSLGVPFVSTVMILRMRLP